MRLQGIRVLSASALASLFGIAVAPAQAVEFNLQVFADGVDISNGGVDQTRLGCVDNADGVSAHCEVSDLVYGGEYPLVNIDTLSLDLDSDPVVTGTTAVTNLFNVTQQITLLFTLPIAPAITPGTLTSGSYRGTVTDNDGNGATVGTVPGSSLYAALIDGVIHQTLYNHSSSTSAGSFLSATISNLSFGLPGQTQLAPQALASIGIRLDFTLTSLDSASFTSNHVVLPIPEPATVGFLGLGLALMARKRRA
jgi:hypothetical protein